MASSSYTLYEGTFPQVKALLAGLSHLLDKADEFAADNSKSADELLEARLAEDMLPLAFQVHFTCDLAQKLVARLRFEEPLTWDKEDVKTVADARARLAEAIKIVNGASRDHVVVATDQMVPCGVGPGKTIQMKASDYVAAYALPNLYFHVVAAYSILRKEGVQLGKLDYLRPFFSPFMTEM